MKIQTIYIFLVAAAMMVTGCTRKMSKSTSTKGQEWRSAAPGAGKARPVELGSYASFELDNGLKVIVVENHKIPRVSYQLSLDNDPVKEGNKAGYVSLAGTMLGKGTVSKSKAELDAAIDYIGASINTSESGIFASSLKKHSSTLLDIMTDMLYNPAFPAEELEKEKKRTISGLATAKTDANAINSNISRVVVYGKDHPYGDVQTEVTTKNVTLDDVKKYYMDFFKPNNAYLVIVGDITPDEAKMQAQKYFGAWNKGEILSFTYGRPVPPAQRKVSFGHKEGAVQSVINIAYPVDMNPGNPDIVKAGLMNSILGGGIFSGRLMQNLREKKAYTYGARSNISNDKLIGEFSAGASVRNVVTDSAVHEFLYEFERLVKEPVSDSDLQLAKNSLSGSFARSLESPQTIANFALNTYRYKLPEDYYKTYLQRLQAVSIADVQDMAKKYILPENCHIIITGNKDDVSEKLKRFDGDGVIDFYDPYGVPVEENNMKIGDGVNANGVIEDYIQAVGGQSKNMSVQNIVTVMETEIMGQKATFETVTDNMDRFSRKISIDKMGVISEQRYNGSKLMESQMGKSNVFTEGEKFELAGRQSGILPQIKYLQGKYNLSLSGIEKVNGADCYVLKVKDESGDTVTEYYDMKTSLLTRSSSTQDGPSGPVSVITDYSDYRDIGGGILRPFKMALSGGMPFPLNMEAKSIEINKTLAPDIFRID